MSNDACDLLRGLICSLLEEINVLKFGIHRERSRDDKCRSPDLTITVTTRPYV